MPYLKAVKTGSRTMVGFRGGEFPSPDGNCFTLITDKGRQFKVIKFNAENFDELLKRKILEYPVDIEPVSWDHMESWCRIIDGRVPLNWYDKDVCKVCGPRGT